jgi:hypothetical protein
MTTMTPDEFLAQARPLKMDAESRENIDLLKEHIQSGKTLDPLMFDAKGKEDGRHRAIAAKELGIKEVPVLDFRAEPKTEPAAQSALKEIRRLQRRHGAGPRPGPAVVGRRPLLWSKPLRWPHQ